MVNRGSTLTIQYHFNKFAAEGPSGTPLEEHARSALLPSPTIHVDPNAFNELWFVDNLGKLHRASITRMLGHELIHALAGYEDNIAGRMQSSDPDRARAWLGNPDADFWGDTVGKFGVPSENHLGEELGGSDGWFRASYLDAVKGSEFDVVASLGVSLTSGTFVEDVFVDISPSLQDASVNPSGTIDFSQRNKSALILGLDGDDKITGGREVDYLYGGDGDDELRGGGSGDFLAGGFGKDKYYTEDCDVILDSSKRSSPQQPTSLVFQGDALAPLEGDGQGSVYFEGTLLAGATQKWDCDNTPFGFKQGDIIYRPEGSTLYVVKGDKILTIKDWVNGNLGITLQTDFDACTPPEPGWIPPPPPTPVDPLVLDLDGNGIQFIALADSQAYYDFAGTGFATKTGWIGPNDGFLVEDMGNGKFDLFGDASQDGFVDLTRFDSNGDGRVTSDDVNFSVLKVWRDLDSDGAADSGEVVSLGDAGVASIDLAATAAQQVVINGTEIGYTGSFTRTDGSTGLAETAYFQVNKTLTKWHDPPPSNWSGLKYGFYLRGGRTWRRGITSRKRSSRSCGRPTFCWRKGPRCRTLCARSA